MTGVLCVISSIRKDRIPNQAFYSTTNHREGGAEFVTRKISTAAAKISLGMEKEIRLGNLEAKRDWGYARDYIRAMWLMLQQKEPDDYVIASGRSHSVRDFLKTAFNYVDLDYRKYYRNI
jgi:GDPmannose 4,6-dehydratase